MKADLERLRAKSGASSSAGPSSQTQVRGAWSSGSGDLLKAGTGEVWDPATVLADVADKPGL